MTAPTLPVSEVFGPVYQGEGPYAGRRCTFLRLGLCNLHCTWCDTPYTWDTDRFDVAKECPPRTPDWILGELDRCGSDLLILSGGEPMIHANNPALRDVLDGWGGEVHVETNGTLPPTTYLQSRVAHFSVSPKLGNQGDPQKRRLRPRVLTHFASMGNAVFKFVCQTPADLDEVAWLVDLYGIPAGRVWIMPEGITPISLIVGARRLEPAVTAHGWNLTLRQHVLIHGNQRGY